MKKFYLLFLCLAAVICSTFLIKNSFFFKNSSIQKISQLSLQKEALSSLYLSELLNLSYDQKKSKEDFDIEEGKKNLLSSPFIYEADLYFIEDNHIQVVYRSVAPIALLDDFENAAIDEDGKIFPVEPFLSPKGLTKIFLGIKEEKETLQIDDYEERSRWAFAKKVLEEINALQIAGNIISIDVSKVEEESLGKNEMVIVISLPKRKDFLRLSKRKYLNELSYYTILCEKSASEEGSYMVDLRHNDCAFIEKF